MARCDSYDFGECTAGACAAASWIPDGLGNGGEWSANAPAHGIMVTDVPTVGAVVSYCPGDGYSPFGHCALVTQVYPDGTFQVYEMNYVAFDQYDSRRSTINDVCGFLLPPGVQAGAGGGAGGPAASPDLNGLFWYWSHLADYYNSGVVTQIDTYVNLDNIIRGI